ncbi:hypothetical protein ACFE04_026726 [Oxalis oulophora]
MEEEHIREGKSLAHTPTWAVATVVTFMVAVGFFFHIALKNFGKWLEKTKRKPLLAALEKIKDELMLFGVLSLLMGHWIVFIAKICIKSSWISSRFYPCSPKTNVGLSVAQIISPTLNYLSNSVSKSQIGGINVASEYCPVGYESFASHESLEQLHRFIFVLGITHVSYSFVAIALAMIKIYSWRTWENQAKTMAIQCMEDAALDASKPLKLWRLSTFIFHHTSHPWSQHGILVWLLCFSRQFWSSISRADYIALRLGFISLILMIGTKLHRIVVKLAVEIMDRSPRVGHHKFNLRDDLFWFGKPELLLWLIQFISFQNAFEMASFLWSMWEVKQISCYTNNHVFAVIRLSFGIISQFWCSFITFPLYVIVTQMGTRFKRSVISENVRKSLSTWHRRVKVRQHPSSTSLVLTQSLPSLDSSDKKDSFISLAELFAASFRQTSSSHEPLHEISPYEENSENPVYIGNALYDCSSDNDIVNEGHRNNNVDQDSKIVDSSLLL